MSTRDELAAIIGTSDGFNPNDFTEHDWDDYRVNADAILAAGYSKPRTITTAEELDALHMVVVRSKGGSIANIVNGRAYVFGYEGSAPASTLALPATVLYEP